MVAITSAGFSGSAVGKISARVSAGVAIASAGVAVGRSFSLWACFGFYCGNTTTSQKYYVLGGRVELR